jgi:transcriptional regulator with XRE-family HTH domain
MRHFVKVSGLSESELAKQTGISQSFVNQTCNGLKTMGMDSIQKVSKYFNIPIESVIELSRIEDESEFVIQFILTQCVRLNTKN